MDEAEAKARLTTERDATRARIEALTRDLDGLLAAATDANLDDEHDPEGATVAFERQQLAALLARSRSQLDDIDLALERLADHTYTVCESCGGPIGSERLKARPAARTCIRCASGR